MTAVGLIMKTRYSKKVYLRAVHQSRQCPTHLRRRLPRHTTHHDCHFYSWPTCLTKSCFYYLFEMTWHVIFTRLCAKGERANRTLLHRQTWHLLVEYLCVTLFTAVIFSYSSTLFFLRVLEAKVLHIFYYFYVYFCLLDCYHRYRYRAITNPNCLLCYHVFYLPLWLVIVMQSITIVLLAPSIVCRHYHTHSQSNPRSPPLYFPFTDHNCQYDAFFVSFSLQENLYYWSCYFCCW